MFVNLRNIVYCLIAVALPGSAIAQAPGTGDARLVLHMLDYIGVDYPEFVRDGEVLDEAEYTEQIEFAAQVEELLAGLPPRPESERLARDTRSLSELINNKAPGTQVAALATRLRLTMVESYAVEVTPQQAPELSAAPALYATHCANCHGVEGYGDGLAGTALEPPPNDFHDRTRQSKRSISALYNTITLGVKGTGMISYADLTDQERWALAFYVSDFSTDQAMRKTGATLWQDAERDAIPDLDTLVRVTAEQIVASHGEKGLALLSFLRGEAQALNATRDAALAFTQRTLRDSLSHYQDGDPETAERLALTAYLEGFELVEASLQTVDAGLNKQIERSMMLFRQLLRERKPAAELARHLGEIERQLDRAQTALVQTRFSAAATISSAFVILLREGLEAILLLAAIIAFLKRSGRSDAMPYIHLGWTSALVAGALTWLAAAFLVDISGIGRETTEGVTALLAAGVLLYVGLWLHGKANVERWSQYLHAKLANVLSRRTLWALTAVSFLAVYREIFETVLFYQALAARADPSRPFDLWLGMALAAIVLALLTWALLKLSVRLPLALFFRISAILVGVLAVVFTGHGIAALQEAGRISVHLLDWPSLPALGFYANLECVLGQAMVLIIMVAGVSYTRYSNNLNHRARDSVDAQSP